MILNSQFLPQWKNFYFQFQFLFLVYFNFINMVGYTGSSYLDATFVLDKSQNRSSVNHSEVGHSRGHAIAPSNRDRRSLKDIDCVEKFSVRAPKSSFMSRTDQNKCAHYALKTTIAKEAMARLNTVSDTETVTVDITSLNLKMALFSGGVMRESGVDASRVVMVLRRHLDRNPDVHVHTMYPISWRISIILCAWNSVFLPLWWWREIHSPMWSVDCTDPRHSAILEFIGCCSRYTLFSVGDCRRNQHCGLFIA